MPHGSASFESNHGEVHVSTELMVLLGRGRRRVYSKLSSRSFSDMSLLFHRVTIGLSNQGRLHFWECIAKTSLAETNCTFHATSHWHYLVVYPIHSRALRQLSEIYAQYSSSGSEEPSFLRLARTFAWKVMRFNLDIAALAVSSGKYSSELHLWDLLPHHVGEHCRIVFGVVLGFLHMSPTIKLICDQWFVDLGWRLSCMVWVRAKMVERNSYMTVLLWHMWRPSLRYDTHSQCWAFSFFSLSQIHTPGQPAPRFSLPESRSVYSSHSLSRRALP